MSAPSVRRSVLLCSAAFVSGVAALCYEVLWVRALGELFGRTTYAVNVVLAVFFAGLGLGAWLLGRVADRRGGSIGLFCALEGVIAVSGLAFWPACRALDALYVALAPSEQGLGASLLVRGVGTTLLLLVPTLAMGGTIPALVRHTVRRTDALAGGVAWLYGANTVGAALGALAAVFVLLPGFGLQGAGSATAVLNLLAIALALVAGVRRGQEPSTSREATSAVPEPVPDAGAVRVVLVAAAWSGLASVGLEVLWTRALAARSTSTVFSFAIMLSVFLVSLGLGSAIVTVLDRRGLVQRTSAAVAMIAAGIAGLLSVTILARLGAVATEGAGAFAEVERHELLQAVLVMTVPALFFGVSFPLLARLAHRALQAVGKELGGVYLANTVGSVTAPLLIGFWVLPAIGLKLSLLAVGWAAVGFGVVVMLPWAGTPRRAGIAATSVAIAFALTIAARGDVRLWREGPGDRLLDYREGVAASIAVVERPDGNRILKLDNAYNLGATRTAFAQGRQGLIPLFLAGDARSLLFIGLGTGSSAGAAAACGGLAIDILEIVPGLEGELPWFASANLDLAGRLAADPAVRLLEVDGRHFVRTTARRYDVVVGDLFIPWRAGEGSMYTREHFDAVRRVLEPGGLFCQWLPLYQLRREELATIAHTFCDVFPAVEVFWLYLNVEQPAIGLVGSNEPLALDPRVLAERAADPARRELLERFELDDYRELLGSWITDREGLLDWARSAPLEERGRPRIEFSAPSSRFGSPRPPAQENVPLLLELTRPLEGEALSDAARYQRATVHYFRADHARVALDRPDEAVRELAAALAETPEWGWIAWNLERISVDCTRSGRFETALAAARTLRTSPVFRATGLYHEAVIRMDQGDLDAAQALAEEGRSLDPEHAGLRRLQDEIARRRSAAEAR